jgi:hypothetical protein
MGFSVESKAKAQQTIRKATPLIPVEIYWLHAAPPVDEQLSFLKAMKPAMDFVCQKLEPGTRPDVIRSAFLEYMKPRWDVFSDPRWERKKSTYPVWYLHMLSYFIATKLPQKRVWNRPEDGSKYGLNQQMEALRPRGRDNRA